MNGEDLVRLLDLARWAPSGDNEQPWRFSVVDDGHLRIHGHDTRDRVLYDFEGRASHIAHGALLETLRVAASGLRLHMEWTVTADADARAPVYDVHFTAADRSPDPLLPYLEQRVVQRRPMRTTPLTPTQRAAIEAAAGNEVIVDYFAPPSARLRVAALLWHNARIRLTCPEAYPVHRDVIEWRARYSKERIPERAIGVDPLTARLMEWVMASWQRVRFFNRYLMGTVVPRLELDFVPGYCCAAHLLLRPRQPPQDFADWVRLGMHLQRVWLTVTQEGLYLQPELTPVIFRWYVRANRRFSTEPALFAQAQRLTERFERLAGCNADDPFFFFCRVGASSTPVSRSLRRDREQLMH